MTTDAKAASGVTIYGMPLGGPLADGLQHVEKVLNVQEDGNTITVGGEIDGMSVQGQLTARGGRLADMQIVMILPSMDGGLKGSAVLERMVTDLGEPNQLMIDLAEWTRGGYKVQLQRMEDQAKDSMEETAYYHVTAKPLDPPAAVPSTGAVGDDPPKHDPGEK